MTRVAGQSLLSVERLSRRFGALAALEDVSFEIAEHERHAVIGPNGAGKTTLFNLITGHLAPTGGLIHFDGAPIHGLAPHVVARRGLSRSFQRTSLFVGLTVLENLRLAAAAGARGSYRIFGRLERLARPLDKALEIGESVGLTARLGERVEHLSYGEQRQLEVGIALATSPRLLLLDEPTAGMSPEETRHMTRLVESLPRDLALLIIEHDMDVVSSLADRVTVLHHGEVLAEGPFAEIQRNPVVYDVYLGNERSLPKGREQ